MRTKVCSKCKIPKLISEFYKQNGTKDNLAYWCKECRSKYYKKYNKIHRIKIKIQKKEYQKRNRIILNQYQKKWQKIKYQNNPIFRINSNMSALISQSLGNNKNGNHWEGLVGYTLNDLKQHLESQFKDGMSWDNHGRGRNKWHIDHKIPRSLFNITGVKSKGFKKCWSLENLQPMWQSDNIKKSNKLFI